MLRTLLSLTGVIGTIESNQRRGKPALAPLPPLQEASALLVFIWNESLARSSSVLRTYPVSRCLLPLVGFILCGFILFSLVSLPTLKPRSSLTVLRTVKLLCHSYLICDKAERWFILTDGCEHVGSAQSLAFVWCLAQLVIAVNVVTTLIRQGSPFSFVVDETTGGKLVPML